ncbi:hypothetical protein ACFQU2_08995 [Siccirubricoccus deserti]
MPIAASPVSNSITIDYKQFGVSLAFVPTVLGPDRLNLRVRPEVSELSDNGAITMPLASGVVRIPALSVRRAETTVELGSGQSFAIAGLLQRGNTMANSGVNGLRDIPVLGALFGSDRYRRNETELVIIITLIWCGRCPTRRRWRRRPTASALPPISTASCSAGSSPAACRAGRSGPASMPDSSSNEARSNGHPTAPAPGAHPGRCPAARRLRS